MTFRQILSHLPEARLVFAYGSGILPQLHNFNTYKNMLDLVIVTDTPRDWHRKNLERNPDHYSFLKVLGPDAVAAVQENFGAGIYYNTLVEIAGRQVKYGVISESTLVDDLLNWKTLYVSGRLHKPVHFIVKYAKHEKLNEALGRNICSALHAALLLLPQRFSEQVLFRTLTGLSYIGDFRMQIGEDQGKVNNIVALNLESFRKLYEGTIEAFESHLHWNKSQGALEQNHDHVTIAYHLNSLPSQLQNLIIEESSNELKDLAQDPLSCQKAINLGLKKIVKASSWNQSLKGIFTAGPTKSFHYGKGKLQKYINSLIANHER